MHIVARDIYISFILSLIYFASIYVQSTFFSNRWSKTHPKNEDDPENEYNPKNLDNPKNEGEPKYDGPQ